MPGTPPRAASLADHRHPIFARVYAAVSALVDRGPVGRSRTALLSGVTGRLLVVGLGPGLDLGHLPGGVTAVVGVEPSAAMLARARRRAARAAERGAPVALVAGVAEALPVADASVDAVLCAFVLCSVDDPAQALAEVRRVLRPTGRLLLLEHVRGREGSLLSRVQQVVDPAWRVVAGGCSVARDTRAAVRAAGFDDAGLYDVRLANFPLCLWHVRGSAVPRRVRPGPRDRVG